VMGCWLISGQFALFGFELDGRYFEKWMGVSLGDVIVEAMA